jgi:hypothetical protein
MDTESCGASDSRRRLGFTFAWIPLVLIAIYVLSVGPVARHYWHLTPSQSVPRIYWPLFKFAGTNQRLEQVFGWYLFTIWHAKPGT